MAPPQSSAAPSPAPQPAAATQSSEDAANPLLSPLRSTTTTLYNMMQQSYSHAGPASTAALLTSSHTLVAQLRELQRLSRAMQQNAAPGPSSSRAPDDPAVTATGSAGSAAAADADAQEPPCRDITLPPEVVAYVQDGRNPDIYTREFVELAMRNNQRLRGKADAFARFAGVLAAEMVGACPEMREPVSRVLGDGYQWDGEGGRGGGEAKTGGLG